jgi:hypothetical protein
MTRRHWMRWFSVAVLVQTAGATAVQAQSGRNAQAVEAAATRAQLFSLDALEALVAGVALYPDPFMSQVLDAAGHPAAVHEAAEAQRLSETRRGGATQYLAHEWPASARFLVGHPETLQELAEHPQLTTLLGAAYRNQPDDVWAAIWNVRAKIEKSAQQSSGGTGTISTFVAAPVVIDGLYAPDAVARIAGVRAVGDAAPAGAASESRVPQSRPAPSRTRPLSARERQAHNALKRRYSRMDSKQITQANHIHSQAWNQLAEQAATLTAAPSNVVSRQPFPHPTGGTHSAR